MSEPTTDDTIRIVLDRIDITCSTVVPDEAVRKLATRAEIQTFRHRVADDFVVHLSTYLHGMTKERIQVNKWWPRDWWEALKDRWAPAWFKKRWPVKIEGVDIDQQIFLGICPHMDTPEGSDGKTCIAWFVDLEKKWKERSHGEDHRE